LGKCGGLASTHYLVISFGLGLKKEFFYNIHTIANGHSRVKEVIYANNHQINIDKCRLNAQ
jgi:hypothetical protein